MNDSLRIGSVFGITIRVHVLFLAMLALVVAWSPTPMQALAGVSLLFLLVFLHELGHSLMAQAFGIKVIDITFWPLGGMARMSDIPESPRIEGLIALAGPAVNFVLAFLGLIAWSVMYGMDTLGQGGLAQLQASPLQLFIAINLTLGTFNLLPAFPMDGGRVLRAFLGRKRDWVSATELAVSVGRSLAFTMFLYGILTLQCWWLLIAAFVWVVGARELAMVRMRHYGHPFARNFGGGPGGFGGSSGGAGGLGDMLENLRRAAAQAQAGGPPHETHTNEGDPERPTVLDVDGPEGSGRPGKKGFSDEDVKRLEGFQGRLRRPPEDP